MPDNPLWMFRPFLSPAPLPLEVISQLQEPMKALQMWLFFSLLLVGAIFDCQKRLIPNTLCALITMVGLLVFHPAQLMGPLAALPLLAAAMHMASVLSTVLSRLNAFLDSEMEQILCFDTAVDAEKFCNEKSAIFVVLPEEDTTKYFMVSLIIQNLYREILTVADENGGRLKNRVVFFADELGSCPPIQSLELMFSASRSRGLMLVPIVQSITGQLQKNYGKEGSEIIVDNCQVNIFGGFAPASQTAEELSKALGSRTVMSGSISRGKNDPSQSLQMMERPLMTPDELKSMPKGSFIVAKTGVHPMRVRLRLFLDWGIRFGEPYEVPEKAQRPVAYADKQELEEAIIRRHYASSIEDEENQVDQGAAAAGGLSQGMRPEANRRKPALRP